MYSTDQGEKIREEKRGKKREGKEVFSPPKSLTVNVTYAETLRDRGKGMENKQKR